MENAFSIPYFWLRILRSLTLRSHVSSLPHFPLNEFYRKLYNSFPKKNKYAEPQSLMVFYMGVMCRQSRKVQVLYYVTPLLHEIPTLSPIYSWYSYESNQNTPCLKAERCQQLLAHLLVMYKNKECMIPGPCTPHMVNKGRRN